MLIRIRDDYERSFSSFSPSHLLQSVSSFQSLSQKELFFQKLVNELDCALFSCLLYSAKLLYYRMYAKTHQLLIAQRSTAHQRRRTLTFRVSKLKIQTITVFDNLLSVFSWWVRLELKVDWLFKRSKIIQFRRSESISGQLEGFLLIPLTLSRTSFQDIGQKSDMSPFIWHIFVFRSCDWYQRCDL